VVEEGWQFVDGFLHDLWKPIGELITSPFTGGDVVTIIVGGLIGATVAGVLRMSSKG
jgi:hypothetical protein